MNPANLEVLSAAITARFGDRLRQLINAHAELTIEVDPDDYLSVCQELRDAPEFQFQQLIDLCGVDYLAYGQDEWQTETATSSGFSRGVESQSTGRLQFGDELNTEFSGPRFAVVLHLLSYPLNQRLRVRCFAADNDLPVVASVTDIWNCADWYEREAFDLYGILFEGHADLRRLLTDYGFVGHPFRKDFPLVGHVEMRYDPETKRVIYQPVSIEPRVLVPRVIRDDFRYVNPTAEQTNARNS